jgi:hypothetical protein
VTTTLTASFAEQFALMRREQAAKDAENQEAFKIMMRKLVFQFL